MPSWIPYSSKPSTGQAGTPVFKAPAAWARLREAVRLEMKLTRNVVRTKQQLKSLYRRRGVACTGDGVYSPRHRGAWIAKLPASVRPSAVILSEEMDLLRDLQQRAEQQMYTAARKFPMWRTLQTAPGIGRKRSAQLLAIVVTPHRFRNKRRFWSYCGLAVVTRSSADWIQQPNGRMLWGLEKASAVRIQWRD